MNKILVTGACGQLGTELVAALRTRYGAGNVIATDIRSLEHTRLENPYYPLDVLDRAALQAAFEKHQISQVYHLAAVLSANGEKDPVGTWDLNMQGLLNVLEAARLAGLDKVFWPSSIAVFGRHCPQSFCAQHAPQQPLTVYGISKAAGELWCQYYVDKYGLDVRSLRYPGLISYQTPPGGGTTDYAVDIFHQAVATGAYTCFLNEKTLLPMLYMPDAIRATLELMDAPATQLTVRTSYNLWGLTFSPAELAEHIRQYIPGFHLTCAPDARQAIADGWPDSINGHQAWQDWGWKHRYDLPAMVADMLWQLGDQPLRRTIENCRESVKTYYARQEGPAL